ncbi:MAG: response regulator [Armatimonadetes bacterium]|nr:response regulator [Anaerolineae bacterium]
MFNNDRAERGTRRLDQEPIEPALPVDDQEALAEYPITWVIELRVVGTPSVVQVRVQDEMVVGRSDPRYDTQPDIDLEPYGAYDLGVSRRHAQLFPKNNRLLLRDLGSSNGTYINGRYLLQGQEYRLRHGDMLTIGKLQLQVFFDIMPASKDLVDKTQPIQLKIPLIGSGEHILVVDNDRDVAAVVGSLLEQMGFNVLTVGTVNDAVTLIDQRMPDVAILELILPGANGLELVNYIRKNQGDKHIPIIIISSAAGGFQMEQAMDAGVDIYLYKPVGLDELIRAVSKTIHQG